MVGLLNSMLSCTRNACLEATLRGSPFEATLRVVPQGEESAI